MTKLSVGIAGCGIAGLACGALLAARGWEVVAFDRMEAPQPLGSGLILQPVGMAVLDAMGLGNGMRARGAVIERLFGKAQPSGRVVLDARYQVRAHGGANGVGAHRGALFALLLDHANAVGVSMETGREILAAEDGRLRFGDGSSSARFDLVIDALGVWSPLSRPPEQVLPFGALWTNIDWPEGVTPFKPSALEQRYERARKMVGLLPIGARDADGQRQASFFWSLRQSAYADWLSGGLEAWKDEVRALWPETDVLLEQIRSQDQLVFASYAHRTLGGALSNEVVHVGDSWHCASPQLGQGANMALLDAWALSRALETHGDRAKALDAYAQMRRWHVRLYQAVSWMFTPAYQSDSSLVSGLRDWVLAPVSKTPPGPQFLSRLVSGQLGAPLAAIRRHAEAGMDDARLSSTAGGH